MALRRDNSVPLYHQLRDLLREQIESGQLPPHTRLPSETELQVRYGVSRMTVRLAMGALVNDGLVYRRPGKGSFVAPPRVSKRFVSMISFTEELRLRGFRPSSKVLEAREIPAADAIAQRLQIPPGTPVVLVRRIRYADGEPVGLNTSHLRADLCPGILEEDLAQGSLYKLIEDRWGVRITRADRFLASIPCPPDLAGLLRVRPGDPILELRGVVYTESGVPLDYCEEYYSEGNER
ncbi:MAG TPA: GntR family transcriptional regulator [Limnochordales bacterium]|nr:GntR family transcriptional regulator [Limnochordales bacterium]